MARVISLSTSTGSAKRSPPCTTRWPDGIEHPVPQRGVDGRVHLFQRLGVVAGALELAVALTAGAHADLLDQAFGEHAAGLDVAHLVLERGRAGVDDEHEHGAS